MEKCKKVNFENTFFKFNIHAKNFNRGWGCFSRDQWSKNEGNKGNRVYREKKFFWWAKIDKAKI